MLVAPALSAADPARLTAAHDLLDALNMRAQIKGTLTQIGDTLPAEGDGKEKVKRMINEEVVPEMLNLTAAGYASRLTVQELEGVTAFYRTPLGQRFGAAQMEQARHIGVDPGERQAAPSADVAPERLAAAEALTAALGMNNPERRAGLTANMPPEMKQRVEAVAQITVMRTKVFFASRFTAEELREVTAFYRQPLGQKFAAAQAEVAMELLQQSGRITARLMRSIIKEMGVPGMRQ